MASIEGCSLVLSSMEDVRSEIDLTALVETYSTLLFRVLERRHVLPGLPYRSFFEGGNRSL